MILARISRLLLFCYRCIVVPLMVGVYFLPLPLLLTIRCCVWCCCKCDDLFDGLARSAGWDSRFWPLPKAIYDDTRAKDV